MHPLIIVLGAALLDVGANMAINRSSVFATRAGACSAYCW